MRKMHKWRIKFFMKNGDMFEGFYEGPESMPGDVAYNVCTSALNNFIDLFGESRQHNLFIRLEEIQACDISPFDGEEFE